MAIKNELSTKTSSLSFIWTELWTCFVQVWTGSTLRRIMRTGKCQTPFSLGWAEGRTVSGWVLTHIYESLTVTLSHLVLTSVCGSHGSKSVSSHLVTDIVSTWSDHQGQMWTPGVEQSAFKWLINRVNSQFHFLSSSHLWIKCLKTEWCFQNHTLHQWSPTRRQSSLSIPVKLWTHWLRLCEKHPPAEPGT